MNKKLFLIITLMMSILSSLVYAEENSTQSAIGTEIKDENSFKLLLKKVYGFDSDKKSGLVPFVYYLNEAGAMVGAFYFNSDTFNLGGKTTVTTMYSPETDIATLWLKSEDFKVSEKTRFATVMGLIKYNDIRNYWPGNDSPDNEANEKVIEDFKKVYYQVSTGALPPSALEDYRKEHSQELRGFKKYHGFNNLLNFRFTYELNDNHKIYFEPQYEVLKNQLRRYQADTAAVGYIIDKKDNDTAPRNGYVAEFKVKKSLNMLSKNDENSWDYYKLTFDGKKYIPMFKKSTLALRVRTETTGGKKVVDKERSLIEGSEIYSYAPFFDMALLGDLEIMRGSYMYRYWGKHSLLFQGEYRFPIMDKEHIQGIIFSDIGRVSNTYGKELLYNMQVNGGVGIRYFFNKDILLRADVGASREGIQFRANLGQAF